MKASNIIAPQRKLRVVHVATQAAPHVPPQSIRGLSDVAGNNPAAERALGLDPCLVLPFFRTTQDIIEAQGHQLQELDTLSLRFGPKIRPTQILTMESTFEPCFPIYFIVNKDFFGMEEPFGWRNDLQRFSFFCHAAMELQRTLYEEKQVDGPPDVFVCHDWQTALITVYVKQIQANAEPHQPATDTFFKNTKTVLAVHDFAFTGAVPEPSYHEVSMGWERSLPGWAECFYHLNPLKAGMFLADRIAVRSLPYFDLVAKGDYGQRGFSAIARELLESEKLIALCKDDAKWEPKQPLTEELALRGARHFISVYRTIIERPFPGMEEAESAFTYDQEKRPRPITHLYQTSTAREIIPRELYDQLDRKDQDLINRRVNAGEQARFAEVKSIEELRDILSFLKIEIKPECDFEQRMRDEGLEEFLAPFFPGDLNRLLSITLDTSRCEELLERDPSLKPEEIKRITLYEAMTRLRGYEGQTLLEHILSHFETLKLIASAADKSNDELAKELRKRGKFRAQIRKEESLALAASDFRQFSMIYNYISRREYQKLFRAFLVAVVLHDLGKLLKHSEHPHVGERIFGQNRVFRGSVGAEEVNFVRKLIKFHSIFGDAFVTTQQYPYDVHDIYALHPDKKLRDYALHCLYLLGIADMNSIGSSGLLTLRDLRDVRQAYNAVLFARNTGHLSHELERLGYSEKLLGNRRWNRWVVREEPLIPSAEDEALRQQDAQTAVIELDKYCKARVAEENQALVQKHKRARAKHKKKRFRDQLAAKTRAKITATIKRLGSVEDIFEIESLTRGMDDAKHRARLLIWLSEYSQLRSLAKGTNDQELKAALLKDPKGHVYFKEIIFEFNTTEERAKLVELLEKFDLQKMTQSLNFKFDPEKVKLEISITA